MDNSKQYQLTKEDGIKILRVAGWLVASSIVSFLITLLPQIDLGSMAWLVPLVNTALVALKKYIKDNR